MINAAIIAANAVCTVAAQVATHAALQANRRFREQEEEDEKRRKEKKSKEEKQNA